MIYKHEADASDRDVLWSAVFRDLQGRSALQIGARPGGSWEGFFQDLSRKGFSEFDVIEVWEPNLRGICSPLLRRKILGNALTLLPELPDDAYDVVIWHHGPEHVSRSEFCDVLPHLKRVARVALYLGMPHGYWPQGEIRNKFDAHVTHWTPEEIATFGFEVHAFGLPHNETPMFGVWREDTTCLARDYPTLSKGVTATSPTSTYVTPNSSKMRRKPVNGSSLRRSETLVVPCPPPSRGAGATSSGCVKSTPGNWTS